MSDKPQGVRLGNIELLTPVMLAPMAGVTNPPFRQLCRESAQDGLHAAGVEYSRALPSSHGTGQARQAPGGLWVCEMVTTRALVERNRETMNMIQPDVGDPVRSIQLYGVQVHTTAEAVRILREEGYADHIDLNFGCPAPKVTRRGGGSALPWKLDLFEEITSAAVQAAGSDIPVTAKIRVGIDDEHTTWREAVAICEGVGIAGLTIHARTMAQHYSGRANWDVIGEVVESTVLPVFGNGDVFSAEDAQELMRYSSCAGVAVGRGCQGRPWLFYDFAAAFHGSDARARPSLAEVAQVIIRHAELSIEHFNGDEHRALRELRKHMSWYTRGFAVGGTLRSKLALVSTLDELRAALNELDLQQAFPQAGEGPRGRAGTPKQPHLPEGWLESRTLSESQREKIAGAELNISGG